MSGTADGLRGSRKAFQFVSVEVTGDFDVRIFRRGRRVDGKSADKTATGENS